MTIRSGLALVAAVSGLAVIACMLRMRVPRRPPALVLSACQAMAPGMKRFKASVGGPQFDVPESIFTVRAWSGDMPPGTIYTVTFKDRAEYMAVGQDDGFFNELKNAFPVFSRHVGKDNVRTREGRIVGKDSWGDLNGGDRWRYVTFPDGDAVGYRPMRPGEARLFDEVINSACLSPN